MADRSIVTRIRAEASQFLSTMKQVESSAKNVGKSAEAGAKQADGAFSGLAKSLRNNGAAWDEVSSKSLIAGGAIAAALGLAAREAINWESAWAGVQKTVDGTDAEMAALEESLRGLTKVLPATHEEIAGVAEAAGQLGVARDDLVRFTEVAIALGESTNLSAEEASTGLAQLANVMGTTSREGVEGYSKLGSALVALGNNGASTEKDILAMSLRIAGAATVVGATEADVLALSNALASVGIEAQIGGGVISRTMLTINSAVAEGGETMAEFARVSGMSAEEFTQRWREDPVAVIGEFITGLGNVTASGGDAAATLTDLGLAGTENASVLLRAAGASDMLVESLELGAQAWEENAALATEAETRYATMESQLQIARNSMRDAAIDAGSVLAPALVKVAEFAASAANAFASMPEPVQGAAVGLAAVASAGLLLVGGGIKVVRTAQELGDAMSTLAKSSPGAATGLTNVGKAAAGLALLAGVAVVIDQLADALASRAVPEVENLAAGLEGLAAGAESVPDFGELFESQNALPLFRKEIETTDDALAAFALSAELALAGGWTDRLERFLGNGALEKFSEQARQIDSELAAMVASGNADAAAKAFELLTAAAEAQGVPVDELTAMFPEYAAAAEDAATSTSGWAAEATAAQEAAAASAQEVRDFASAILEQHNAALAASNANIAWEQSLDSVNEAIAENGQTAIDNGNALDISTEAGQNNASALNALAAQALATAEANLVNGASVEEVEARLIDARAAFVTAAQNMGMNEAAANALADEFGITSGTAATLKSSIEAIPNDKLTTFSTNASVVLGQIQSLQTAINNLKGKTVVIATTFSGPGAQYVRPGTVGINADGGLWGKADGGLVQAFAHGGTYDGTIGAAQPQIRPYSGPTGILWSEEGSGPWEAFISGHPAKKPRSRAIASETVARLGGEVNWRRFADGGMMQTRTQAATAAASLDPAAIRAALEGTTITLTGVDYLANATSARITRAVRAGV